MTDRFADDEMDRLISEEQRLQDRTRQIVRISVSDRKVLALCNDGTLWVLGNDHIRWHLLPKIPQGENG